MKKVILALAIVSVTFAACNSTDNTSDAKTDSPKVAAPKMDSPKVEAPKMDSPKVAVPKK